MAHQERGANRKFGDMEASQRNLRMAGKPPMRKNCGVAGCAMLVPMDQQSCGMHDFHEDTPHAYPRYEQRHTHFGGESHNVSYDTHVGSPENKKNKL